MAAVTASAPTASTPAIEHPLRNPQYRLWLIGGTISLLGDQFYMVALPWLILEKTGSAVAMGTVMMVGSIPRALLMLMGGAISDRISARKIMMTTATARTICVAVIGILIWFSILQMSELYALAIIFGVADAFAAPAGTAYLPSLLKPEQLVAASSVGQSVGQVTTITGPIPAGFVIKRMGVAWAFIIDAVSFLFIIGALWKLPDPPKSQAPPKAVLTAIAEGIAYVLRDVPLRSLMLLATMMNFCFFGPVGIGLTYLTKTLFGSPAILGALMSAVAVGSLLGALLAGVWKIRRRGLLILLVAVVLAPCLVAIGFIERLLPLAGLLFGIGVLAAFMNVHISAWVMQRIDAAVRGRVASVLMLATFGIMPISFALAGFLIAWNLKFTFLIAGLAMLITAVGASLQKSVREIE
ncbi:MAG TPA: MFS transporter [Candidatus Angelobacter sp.]|nr:MFS transporter [Candidatus Angelobacter sp.]